MSKAAALREEALAKLMEAKAYSETADMDPVQLDELMSAFRALDATAAKAQTTDDQLGTIKDRLEWYAGKATGAPVHFSSVSLEGGHGKSMGQLFVESKEYRDVRATGAFDSDRSAFRSNPFLAAATDVIQTGSGGSGEALVVPQYLPGVLPLPQRPLVVRDLFSQGQMTSETVSYAQQTAFSSAAAAVAQATSVSTGAKPQSSVSWTRITSPAETIATWMAVTRQSLADAGQVRALIDNQLTLMLKLEEEDQLLNGSGISPNLKGIYHQVGLQTLDLAGASSKGDPNLDGIRTGIKLVKIGIAKATADGVVLHPSDSEEFDLMTDGFGRYRIGDPFAFGATPKPIWGLNRVESLAQEEGTALVGAFKFGATVLERQGITILTADQHADFFVRNLVVVLVEERLGFPVYFPAAFVKISLKDFSYLSGS